MPDAPLRVGVIGCGTAGPAAAMYLARAGHRVTLLERFASPGPVGAGLLIQPVGQAVLHDLGLLTALAPKAAPVRRLLGRTVSGRVVMDLKYADLRPGLAGMGVARGDLFGALLNGAERAGVEFRLGQTCNAISRADASLTVSAAEGHSHGPFDLVVVADGARSGLRPPGLVKRDVKYPWGAMWFTCDRPADIAPDVLEQTYADTRHMLGFLPIGSDRLAVFWSVPIGAAASVRARPIGEWKDAVVRLSPQAAALVEQVRSWDEVAMAPYFDTVLTRWHESGVVYLGDAGHAMSPQLGMGANLALVDAAVLASCVATEPDVNAALARYSRERRGTIGYYQRVSRLLTPWFQSSRAWLAPIRDLAMPAAIKAGPLRRQMLLALAGVKRGWLHSAELPPPTHSFASESSQG